MWSWSLKGVSIPSCHRASQKHAVKSGARGPHLLWSPVSERSRSIDLHFFFAGQALDCWIILNYFELLYWQYIYSKKPIAFDLRSHLEGIIFVTWSPSHPSRSSKAFRELVGKFPMCPRGIRQSRGRESFENVFHRWWVDFSHSQKDLKKGWFFLRVSEVFFVVFSSR